MGDVKPIRPDDLEAIRSSIADAREATATNLPLLVQGLRGAAMGVTFAANTFQILDDQVGSRAAAVALRHHAVELNRIADEVEIIVQEQFPDA